MSNLERVSLVQHPVVLRYLSVLRDKTSDTSQFRSAMNNIATILAYHALKDVPLREKPIETPVKTTTGYEFDAQVVIIPILRAGLSLVDGIVNFVSEAKVGHIGVYRDEETHKPVNYYDNLPKGIEDAYTLIVDPMLATGGSASHAINFLKEQDAKNIRMVCLIAAPDGIDRLEQEHPDVPLVTAAIDEKLNENAFIVPGLGDAGDRYFGTT